jgi:hypothetical protein
MKKVLSIITFTLSLVFFPSFSYAANVQISGVLSAKTQLSRGEVFEVQVAAVINGSEYFGSNGGGACRSDSGLFIGWIQGIPMIARFGCTVPTDIAKGATIELVAYQFRNCDNGEITCSRVKSTQKFSLLEEDSVQPTPESSENIEGRIQEKKPALLILFEALFKGSSPSQPAPTTAPSNGGTTPGQNTPAPQPTTGPPDGNPNTGNSGDILTLSSTAATTECLMMNVAANYKHGGRNVNEQCQNRSTPKKFQDECIPWELLGAIQEKETGLPGESIYFSATADQVVQNTKNACSVLVGACPTSESSYAGGTGGAMGISQFMPGTWVGHKNAVFDYEAARGYTANACDPNSSSYPVKIGSCYPGQNCSAATNYREYSHPCNVMAALYAMANKLYNDSGRTTCKTDGWTVNEVHNAAGRYFGMCVYNGNTYCADIVNKMKDRGYKF